MTKKVVRTLSRFAAGLTLVVAASAHAALISVDTDSTVIGFGSVVLGDYQLAHVGGNGNLIDGTPDFAVVNNLAGASLVLSRVDGMLFDIESVFAAGLGSTSINGVTVNVSLNNFQEFFVGLEGSVR